MNQSVGNFALDNFKALNHKDRNTLSVGSGMQKEDMKYIDSK